MEEINKGRKGAGMMEKITIEKEIHTLKATLLESIKHWRIGNDLIGYETFITSIEHLELIINRLEKSSNKIIHAQWNDLLLILQRLHQLIQQQDVIGITDVLEFNILPFIQEWEEDVKVDAK